MKIFTADFAKQSKKYVKLAVIFTSCLIALVILLTWSFGEIAPFSQFRAAFAANWHFFLMAGLFLVIIIFVDMLKYINLFYRATGKFKPFLSLRITALGRFYESITPFMYGGSSYQTAYLQKKDLPHAVTLSVPMAQTFMKKLIFNLLFFILLLSLGTSETGLRFFAYVSLAFKMIVPLTFFLFTIEEALGRRLIVLGLNMLYALRLIKDYNETLEDALDFFANLQSSMRSQMKGIKAITTMTALYVLEFAAFVAIPYVLYLGVGAPQDIAFPTFLVMFIVCYLTYAASPTPMGEGAAELAFLVVFGAAMGGFAIYVIILWRLLVYYSYLIFGAGFFIRDKLVLRRNRN
jgi:hypothetical protein